MYYKGFKRGGRWSVFDAIIVTIDNNNGWNMSISLLGGFIILDKNSS